jgi:hypothetical protein
VHCAQVLNTQRDRIYAERRKALLAPDLSDVMLEYSEETMNDILEVRAACHAATGGVPAPPPCAFPALPRRRSSASVRQCALALPVALPLGQRQYCWQGLYSGHVRAGQHTHGCATRGLDA